MKRLALFIVVMLLGTFSLGTRASVSEPVASMAHMLVREWIGKGQLPVDSDYFGADTMVQGVLAVRVTVRDRGIAMGSGEAVAWELGDIDGFKDLVIPKQLPLMKLVELATQRAIDDVQQSLLNARLDAIKRGVDPEKVKQQTWDDIGFRLKVELQIAVDLEPIERLEGDPPAMVMQRFMPGYHGLWLRASLERQPTLIWPADALAGNLSARSQITAAMAGQKLLITELGRLGQPMNQRSNGVDLRRFRVLHSVDHLAAMPPVILERGLMPLDVDQVTTQSVEQAADILVKHLANRLTALRGTYRPSGDTYEPLRNSPVLQEHLLACLAMARYGQRKPDVFKTMLAAEASNWTQQATGRFDALLETYNRNPTIFDPPAQALLLLCLLEWPLEHAKFDQWRQTLIASLIQLTRDDGTVGQTPQAESDPLATIAAALVTYALAQAYVREPKAGIEPERLGAMLDRLFVEVTQRPDLGVLCWTTLAHDAAAAKLVEVSGQTTWLKERETAFNALLDSLLTRQVRRLDDPGDLSHVLGGMDFKPRTVEGPVIVNWQTAYMLLTLADRIATLANADDVEAEPLDDQTVQAMRQWLLSSQLAVRFMMQLQFDRAEAFYVRNLDETLGGVRLSPDDNRLTIGPSAITLLAMTRMLDATRAMRLTEAKRP